MERWVSVTANGKVKLSLAPKHDYPEWVAVSESLLFDMEFTRFSDAAKAHEESALWWCCWVLFSTPAEGIWDELASGGIGLAHERIRQYVKQRAVEATFAVSEPGCMEPEGVFITDSGPGAPGMFDDGPADHSAGTNPGIFERYPESVADGNIFIDSGPGLFDDAPQSGLSAGVLDTGPGLFTRVHPHADDYKALDHCKPRGEARPCDSDLV